MDAWPAWTALAGVIVAIVVGFGLSANTSAGVRYAGMMLQIFGLGTVAIGLSQVRRSFGRPSLVEKVVAWFRQLVAAFLPPKPITGQANAGGVVTVAGEARVVVRAGPDASLDRRVTILEENLDRLRDEIDAKESKVRTELSTVKAAVEQEQRARETEARRLSSQMEELAVGGLHLELIGLAWLILGVLGTSIPDELAKLL
jgi:hypothetical protein